MQSEVTGTAIKVNHIVHILRDKMLRLCVIYFPSTTMLRWLVRKQICIRSMTADYSFKRLEWACA